MNVAPLLQRRLKSHHFLLQFLHRFDQNRHKFAVSQGMLVCAFVVNVRASVQAEVVERRFHLLGDQAEMVAVDRGDEGG
jgi:hypothetical protein